MTSSSALIERAMWEYNHNLERISIYDSRYQFYIKVDVILLIAPSEYANPNENKRYRSLAIEQGVFTPHPDA